MSDSPALDAVLALLSDGGSIAPPAVSEVVSVIRSGDSFLIAPPGLAPTAPAGMFIAPLVMEWGYDVEYDRARQFQRWLQDNEPALASSAPAGVSYRGTYAVFAESDLSLGSYRNGVGLQFIQCLAIDALALQSTGFAVWTAGRRAEQLPRPENRSWQKPAVLSAGRSITSYLIAPGRIAGSQLTHGHANIVLRAASFRHGRCEPTWAGHSDRQIESVDLSGRLM